MGAAIAAHLANAGIPVVLLDAVPAALAPDEEKRKLTLQHPAVRNRLVRAGLERATAEHLRALRGHMARGLQQHLLALD